MEEVAAIVKRSEVGVRTDNAWSELGSEQEHRSRRPVIGSRTAVFCDATAEFRYRHAEDSFLKPECGDILLEGVNRTV